MSTTHKVTFRKPVNFEGKEVKEVDLSGLENLTTGDLIEADNTFNATGQFALVNEMTTGYACIIASKVTNLPLEFYQQLPAKDGMKVKTVVMSFLND